MVVHKTVAGVTTEDRWGLHNNWAFVNGLNTRYNLPDVIHGAEFRMPLRYKGRGRMESLALPKGETDADAWFGYRLRFRGLERTQKHREADHAIG